MADYEDQNSSEYKDMNQETQAADPNPHSAGHVPQAPAGSSRIRTVSHHIGRISTITDSRPAGRTSRSARDARKTPSQRSL